MTEKETQDRRMQNPFCACTCISSNELIKCGSATCKERTETLNVEAFEVIVNSNTSKRPQP
eukprot:scaffold55807_cov32-Tisochrysis_lutea.AAC.1